MKNYFFGLLIAVAGFVNIQAYRYTFNNQSDTRIKADVNLKDCNQERAWWNDTYDTYLFINTGSKTPSVETKQFKETFIEPGQTGVINPGSHIGSWAGCGLYSAKVQFLDPVANGAQPKTYKPVGGRVGNINFTVNGKNGNYDLQVH